MSMTCHWVTALQSQRFQDRECRTGSGMLTSTSVFLKTFNLQKYADLKSNILIYFPPKPLVWVEDVFEVFPACLVSQPVSMRLPGPLGTHFVQVSVDWYQVLISKDQKTLSELRWGFSCRGRVVDHRSGWWWHLNRFGNQPTTYWRLVIHMIQPPIGGIGSQWSTSGWWWLEPSGTSWNLFMTFP